MAGDVPESDVGGADLDRARPHPDLGAGEGAQPPAVGVRRDERELGGAVVLGERGTAGRGGHAQRRGDRGTGHDEAAEPGEPARFGACVSERVGGDGRHGVQHARVVGRGPGPRGAEPAARRHHRHAGRERVPDGEERERRRRVAGRPGDVARAVPGQRGVGGEAVRPGGDGPDDGPRGAAAAGGEHDEQGCGRVPLGLGRGGGEQPLGGGVRGGGWDDHRDVPARPGPRGARRRRRGGSWSARAGRRGPAARRRRRPRAGRPR